MSRYFSPQQVIKRLDSTPQLMPKSSQRNASQMPKHKAEARGIFQVQKKKQFQNIEVFTKNSNKLSSDSSEELSEGESFEGKQVEKKEIELQSIQKSERKPIIASQKVCGALRPKTPLKFKVQQHLKSLQQQWQQPVQQHQNLAKIVNNSHTPSQQQQQLLQKQLNIPEQHQKQMKKINQAHEKFLDSEESPNENNKVYLPLLDKQASVCQMGGRKSQQFKSVQKQHYKNNSSNNSNQNNNNNNSSKARNQLNSSNEDSSKNEQLKKINRKRSFTSQQTASSRRNLQLISGENNCNNKIGVTNPVVIANSSVKFNLFSNNTKFNLQKKEISAFQNILEKSDPNNANSFNSHGNYNSFNNNNNFNQIRPKNIKSEEGRPQTSTAAKARKINLSKAFLPYQNPILKNLQKAHNQQTTQDVTSSQNPLQNGFSVNIGSYGIKRPVNQSLQIDQQQLSNNNNSNNLDQKLRDNNKKLLKIDPINSNSELKKSQQSIQDIKQQQLQKQQQQQQFYEKINMHLSHQRKSASCKRRIRKLSGDEGYELNFNSENLEGNSINSNQRKLMGKRSEGNSNSDSQANSDNQQSNLNTKNNCINVQQQQQECEVEQEETKETAPEKGKNSSSFLYKKERSISMNNNYLQGNSSKNKVSYFQSQHEKSGVNLLQQPVMNNFKCKEFTRTRQSCEESDYEKMIRKQAHSCQRQNNNTPNKSKSGQQDLILTKNTPPFLDLYLEQSQNSKKAHNYIANHNDKQTKFERKIIVKDIFSKIEKGGETDGGKSQKSRQRESLQYLSEGSNLKRTQSSRNYNTNNDNNNSNTNNALWNQTKISEDFNDEHEIQNLHLQKQQQLDMMRMLKEMEGLVIKEDKFGEDLQSCEKKIIKRSGLNVINSFSNLEEREDFPTELSQVVSQFQSLNDRDVSTLLDLEKQLEQNLESCGKKSFCGQEDKNEFLDSKICSNNKRQSNRKSEEKKTVKKRESVPSDPDEIEPISDQTQENEKLIKFLQYQASPQRRIVDSKMSNTNNLFDYSKTITNINHNNEEKNNFGESDLQQGIDSGNLFQIAYQMASNICLVEGSKELMQKYQKIFQDLQPEQLQHYMGRFLNLIVKNERNSADSTPLSSKKR